MFKLSFINKQMQNLDKKKKRSNLKFHFLFYYELQWKSFLPSPERMWEAGIEHRA